MALSCLVTALVAAGFLCAATDAACAYGEDEAGVCSMALPTPRYGGALIQTNKVVTMPAGSASVEPQELALSFATRINSIESRVTTLEQESFNGRTELKTGLDALTATVEAVRAGGDGSLEHTTGRVGDAETHINTLTDTVSTKNSELRAEIAAVRNDFENLGTTVGQQSGLSLLQARDPAAMLAEGTEAPAAAAAPAAPAAPAAASTAGQPMNSRVASLEARVAKLQTDSSTGRDELTSQLEALTQTVESIRAGGVTSLSHTISRLTSAEQQIASLDGNRASQQDTAQALIDTLQTSVSGLASRVGQGVALAQTNADREEPAAASATTLPLSTRISSLETSVASLEQASASGRAMLVQGRNSLTESVETMRAGGVTSVEFTTGRVTAAEAQLGALEASSTQRNIDLTAHIAAVRASLLSLTDLVGR